MYDKVDLFTQALNSAFVNSYEMVAEPAPIDDAILEIPSAGRIENYPWLYPPPFLHEWKGYRQYAHLGETNYRVPNKTYTAEFEVPFEDLEDDQIGGFKLQAAGMAEGAKVYPGIQCQITLAAGQTTKCFDDTYVFATSHTVGTGNNIVTGTATVTDNVTHAMAVLVYKRKMVKPLLWQRREGPNFRTDAGDNVSSQNRMVRWWSDMRGAAAFGFWWDLLLVTFPSTPSVVDMQTTLGTVNARLRSFTYPKNLASDPAQYIHGQTEFNDKSVMIVCSNGIEHIVRQALTLSLIGASENYFRGWARLVSSGYLNNVVA